MIRREYGCRADTKVAILYQNLAVAAHAPFVDAAFQRFGLGPAAFAVRLAFARGGFKALEFRLPHAGRGHAAAFRVHA